MKRHIPGLHLENRNSENVLEGVFLARVERTFYRWHPHRPFYSIRFSILEPKEHKGQSPLRFALGRLFGLLPSADRNEFLDSIGAREHS